jgi:hypothetical protein
MSTTTSRRKARNPSRKHGTAPATVAPVPLPRESRFFLGTDSSSHWYLVPLAIADEWSSWNELSEDDPASWTPPKEAQRIDGPYGLMFTDPREAGE